MASNTFSLIRRSASTLATLQSLTPHTVIRHANELLTVTSTPNRGGKGRGAGFYTLQCQELRTRARREIKFRNGEEKIQVANLVSQALEYSYTDISQNSPQIVAIHPRTYEEYSITPSLISGGSPLTHTFLQSGMPLDCLMDDDQIVSYRVPATAVYTVKSNETAQATLEECDAKIGLPQHLSAGDRVYVNLLTGNYVKRASKRD